MGILSGIVAGLIAGICMGLASEAGYRLGLIKANLIHIDGIWLAQIFRIRLDDIKKYILGFITHCVMGAAFGLIYVLLAGYLTFDGRDIMYFIPYIFLLWLIMLLFAMPVAGQGLLGKKSGHLVWLEQMAVHIIFGIILWLGLGIFRF